jgi:hypothetical protein
VVFGQTFKPIDVDDDHIFPENNILNYCELYFQPNDETFPAELGQGVRRDQGDHGQEGGGDI